MDKNGMAYDEYLELLKKEVETLNVKQRNLTVKNDAFAKCCKIINKNNKETVILGVDVMVNLLKTSHGKDKFKTLLKFVFGEAFFDELSEKEKSDYQKQGLFMKDDLSVVLGEVYGFKRGYLFKNPNSWDEMITFLNNCVNVCNDWSIKEEEKDDFYKILFSLKKLIETSYDKSMALKKETSFIISVYNEFILAFENKRKVNINKESYDLIRNILNKDNRKFMTIEDGTEKEIGFGDAFVMFSELYNNDLELLINKNKENKESLKIERRAQKYYKRIKSIPFDELENKFFPKYTNENYVMIIKKVIDLFLNDLNADEKWLPYYTAVIMHYASYFKTKYYDEDQFKKEQAKTYDGRK